MTFYRDNARWLLGGFLLTFFSAFGQTFFISIWGSEIRDTYGLTHGGFGGIYMVATLASDGSTEQTVFQLVMPDGSDIPDGARLVARGQRLNVVVGGMWLALDVKKLSL